MLQMRDATKDPILYKTECQVGNVNHTRLKGMEGKREKMKRKVNKSYYSLFLSVGIMIWLSVVRIFQNAKTWFCGIPTGTNGCRANRKLKIAGKA